MARRRRGRAGRRRQAASASVTMLEQRLGERPLGDPLTPVLLEHLRRVCRRQRMPVPLPWRHHICRGCHGALRPGHEARVRIEEAATDHNVLEVRSRAPFRTLEQTKPTGGLKAHRLREGSIPMGEIPNHIRREAASKDVKPTVRVGRSGLTEALVEEVDGQLRQRAMVKIKVNRGVFDRENLGLLWDTLVERTGAVLVLSRGNVGVLWRR